MPRNMLTLFADCRCAVAEGPLWHEREQQLYWLDIPNGTVYRKYVDGKPENYEKFSLDVGKIGGMVFSENNSLLLFAEAGRVWRWQPGNQPVLHAELTAANQSRFNDVISDSAGHIFCGVAPEAKGKPGSLWCMDDNRRFSCIESATAGMPNGMGFSPDRRYFYFTVSDERTIYRYEYDQSKGVVYNPYPLIKVPEDEGCPDGMTVDRNGCIWSAQWDGYRLVQYSPDGVKGWEYHSPIAKITSIALGPHSSLYVTTANYPWREDDYAMHKAGSVFILA